MKHYEIATVFHPDLEIDIETPIKKIESLITEHEGVVDKKDNWGKRKLAYRINGQEWGVFVFFQVQLEPNQVAAIETALKISDEVMRYLIVSLENQKMVSKTKQKGTQKSTEAPKVSEPTTAEPAKTEKKEV